MLAVFAELLLLQIPLFKRSVSDSGSEDGPWAEYLAKVERVSHVAPP